MDRLRSSLTAPGGARTLGVLVALAGIALLVVGVLALGGGGDPQVGAAPPATTASAAPSEPAPTAGTGVGSTPAPVPPPTTVPTAPTTAPTTAPSTAPTAAPTTATTTGPPAPPATPGPTAAPANPRAPLTVLNNSTIRGLADRAASEAQQRGWRIAQVGNFAGRLPTTTVYYQPGDPAQEAAARQLAAEFPHVEQVLPRYAGLPPTPPGIVLVVTRTW